jgi:hypothetical protein
LLALVFFAVLAGGFFPQRIATATADMEKWRMAHPFLFPWAERFGLFHLFSTPWFTALLFLTIFSLVMSCWDQFGRAWRKTFDTLPAEKNDNVLVTVSGGEMALALRHEGYLPLANGDGLLRFVRHPWGYWGSFLLHFGMVVTIASSLFVALTGQRGRLNLVQGEIHEPAHPWVDEERGLLASPFVLSGPVRLNELRLGLASGNTVESVTSDIGFFPVREEEKRSVAINTVLHYRGLRVYQSTDYGDAFTLEFVEPGGTVRRERLLMPHPLAPDLAGYNDFALPWLGNGLSAKYYADAERRSLLSGNPLLVLRLVDHGREVARVSLRMGERGVLGDLKVSLVRVEKWAGLIFVNIAGMSLIFCGFFIVVCGTVLNYMAVPREFIARATPQGYSVSWRAARFADFYADEFEKILKKLSEESLT